MFTESTEARSHDSVLRGHAPWSAGLRGAIPYALSLHLGLEPLEKRQLIGTTTIIIVLFTILILGGGTMPLIRMMDIEESQSRRKSKSVTLSKTEKMVSHRAGPGAGPGGAGEGAGGPSPEQALNELGVYRLAPGDVLILLNLRASWPGQ